VIKRALRTGTTGLVTYATHHLVTVLTAKKPRWKRRNFRDRQVNLSGGATAAAGTALLGFTATNQMTTWAWLIPTTTAGVLGYIDDMDPNPEKARGFRGHIGALTRGEVTTGALKLVGISTAALISGAILSQRHNGRGIDRIVDVMSCGGLIAISANLINLFDLRPGRALKVAGALCLTAGCNTNPDIRILGSGLLGVVGACAPQDLGEQTMLGDMGANPIGAGVGVLLALMPRRRHRLIGVGVVTGLTLLSEKVSFSSLIDKTPFLAWVDRLGRAP